MLGASALSQLPAETGIEVAFAGRSNAGKSSVLNTLTGRKKLARTSKTPGRTREINLFDAGADCRIVDLPGYGFAKVTRSMQEQWSKLLDSYLRQRACLGGLILIMDIRHPLRELDEQLVVWCRESNMPLHALLTKADKLSRGRGMAQLHLTQTRLAQLGSGASVQLFSAPARMGIEALEAVLDRWFRNAAEVWPDANLQVSDQKQ